VEVNLDIANSFPLRKSDHCESSIYQVGVPLFVFAEALLIAWAILSVMPGLPKPKASAGT